MGKRFKIRAGATLTALVMLVMLLTSTAAQAGAEVTFDPDTETLRPNATGIFATWSVSDTSDWEATSDENDATYLYATSPNKDHFLNIDNTSIGDDDSINSVTVWVRARSVGGSGQPEKMKIGVYTYTTSDYSSVITVSRDTFNDYSHTWDVNPYTENAWTKQELNDLQIGLYSTAVGSEEEIRVSKMWAVVLGEQVTAAQAGVGITFDRRLSGDRVGQHKAPPLAPVNMMITVTVSSQVDNVTLADYFPSGWYVTDANGGVVDEDYNKIEWDVGTVSDSVSRSYVIKSPQRTLPPTKYYFHSELTYEGGSVVSDDWMVIVADPPSEETLEIQSLAKVYIDSTPPELGKAYPEGTESSPTTIDPGASVTFWVYIWERVEDPAHPLKEIRSVEFRIGIGSWYTMAVEHDRGFVFKATYTNVPLPTAKGVYRVDFKAVDDVGLQDIESHYFEIG